MDSSSLAHCKWECQYHIEYIPKYRKKRLYGVVGDDVREIIRTLCKYKKVEIIAGAVCADYVHLCVSIPPKLSVSDFVGYLKGKSALMVYDKHPDMESKWDRSSGHVGTTVTAIYDSARKKVADALVHGKRLLITGGCCEFEPVELHQIIMEKGSSTMRIAVTYENGEVFQHFGHSEQFKLYDVEDGKIIGEQAVDTNGSGHGALAGFLHAAKVDALICGGIGMGAQMALADAGIKLYAGVQGSADAAAKSLASGTLEYDPDAHCDHHGHHHDGDCGHDHCADYHCHGN